MGGGEGGFWQRPFDRRNKNITITKQTYTFKTGGGGGWGGWGGLPTPLTQGETKM